MGARGIVGSRWGPSVDFRKVVDPEDGEVKTELEGEAGPISGEASFSWNENGTRTVEIGGDLKLRRFEVGGEYARYANPETGLTGNRQTLSLSKTFERELPAQNGKVETGGSLNFTRDHYEKPLAFDPDLELNSNSYSLHLDRESVVTAGDGAGESDGKLGAVNFEGTTVDLKSEREALLSDTSINTSGELLPDNGGFLDGPPQEFRNAQHSVSADAETYRAYVKNLDETYPHQDLSDRFNERIRSLEQEHQADHSVLKFEEMVTTFREAEGLASSGNGGWTKTTIKDPNSGQDRVYYEHEDGRQLSIDRPNDRAVLVRSDGSMEDLSYSDGASLITDLRSYAKGYSPGDPPNAYGVFGGLPVSEGSEGGQVSSESGANDRSGSEAYPTITGRDESLSPETLRELEDAFQSPSRAQSRQDASHPAGGNGADSPSAGQAGSAGNIGLLTAANTDPQGLFQYGARPEGSLSAFDEAIMLGPSAGSNGMIPAEPSSGPANTEAGSSPEESGSAPPAHEASAPPDQANAQSATNDAQTDGMVAAVGWQTGLGIDPQPTGRAGSAGALPEAAHQPTQGATDPTLAAQSGIVAARSLGSTLAQQADLDSPWETAAVDSLGTTLGQNIGQQAVNGAEGFSNFNSDLAGNLTGTATGLAAGEVAGELNDELGFSGNSFGDQAGSFATTYVTTSTLNAGLDAASAAWQGGSATHAAGGSLSKSFLGGGAASAGGGMVGSYAAQEYGDDLGFQAETQTGATMAAVGSAVGAYAGAAIGSIVPVAGTFVGAAVGSFVGNAVGSVVGDAFGSKPEPPPPPPEAFAEFALGADGQSFQVTTADSAHAGNAGGMAQLAEGAADTINALVDQIGGQIANPEGLNTLTVGYDGKGLYAGAARKDGIHFGHGRGQDYTGRAEQDGGLTQFDSAGDLRDQIVIQTLKDAQIEGGDTLAKRALYNSDAETLAELGQDIATGRAYSLLSDFREAAGPEATLDKDQAEQLLEGTGLDSLEALESRVEALQLDQDHAADTYSRFSRAMREQGADLSGKGVEDLVMRLDGDGTLTVAAKDPGRPEAPMSALGQKVSMDWYAQDPGAATLYLDDGTAVKFADLMERAGIDETSGTVDLEQALLAGYDTAAENLKHGTSEGDALEAGDSATVLEGRGGADRLTGGASDDLLAGGTGADELEGGAGTDTADYGGSESGVAVDLQAGTGQGGTATGDRLSGIERLAGSDHGDMLGGDDGANRLAGGEGGDTLSGRAGSDELLGGSGADTLAGGEGDDAGRGGSGADLIDGGAGRDDLAGDGGEDRVFAGSGSDGDRLVGGLGADQLVGNAGANYLAGQAGSDFLRGGAGRDSLAGGAGDDLLVGGSGADFLRGGEGEDTAAFAGSLGDYRFQAQNDLITVRTIEGAKTATLTGVERLAFADGTVAAGTLKSLLDQPEPDLDEEDRRSSGAAATSARALGTAAALAISATEATAESPQAPLPLFGRGPEGPQGNVPGGQGDGDGGSGAGAAAFPPATELESFNWVIPGPDQQNSSASGQNQAPAAFLNEAPQDPAIQGRGGVDADLALASTTLDQEEVLAELAPAATGGGSTSGDDDSAPNDPEGDTGQGPLTGAPDGQGAPDPSQPGAYEAQNQPLVGTSGDDHIVDQANRGGLYGLAGDDTLVGLSGGDRMRGGPGDDVLRGGAGPDELYGGSGWDTADYRDSAAGVTVDLSAGIAQKGAAAGDLLVNIEHLAGSGYADQLVGDEGSNRLRGRAGSDHLEGRGGQDRLEGGLGADLLSGGKGGDTLLGGVGNDTLHFDDVDFVVDGGSGSDRAIAQGPAVNNNLLRNLEFAQGTEGNDLLGAVGGTATTLKGGDGEDTLIGSSGNDRLVGQAGADALDGGGGDDRLVVDKEDFTPAIDGGAGWDTVELGTAGHSWKFGGGAFPNIEAAYGSSGNDLLTNVGNLEQVTGGQGADTARVRGGFWEYQAVLDGFDSAKLTNRETGNTTTVETEVLEFSQGGGEKIFLDGRNNDPIVRSESFALQEDATLRLNPDQLLGNDIDVDPGNNMRISAVTGGPNGSASLQNGSVVYRPDTNFNGSTHFNYTASDGQGGSRTGRVGLEVTAVNDAPTLKVGEVSYNGKRDLDSLSYSCDYSTCQYYWTAAEGDGQILGKDVDDSNGSLTYSLEQGPKYGDLEFNSDGSFRYELNRDEDAPQKINSSDFTREEDQIDLDQAKHISFDVAITDPHGATTEETITITNREVGGGGGKKPVALDLDGDGLEYAGIDDSDVLMDVNSDGWLEATAWTGPDDGLLALDRNGDGRVNGFQEVAFAGDHPEARTDMEGLALAHDTSGNGRLDPADAGWEDFGVWRDTNSNGHQEQGEFRSLEQHGIQSIGLNSDGSATFGQDTLTFGTSSFVSADGSRGMAGDVMFLHRDTGRSVSELLGQGHGKGFDLDQVREVLEGLNQGISTETIAAQAQRLVQSMAADAGRSPEGQEPLPPPAELAALLGEGVHDPSKETPETG